MTYPHHHLFFSSKLIMTEWHERKIFMKTLHEKSNPLKWWQPSIYSFPAFFYLARKVLSALVSNYFQRLEICVKKQEINCCQTILKNVHLS